MRRSVNAMIADVVLRLPAGRIAEGVGMRAYFLGGLGVYNSARIATRYNDCQPTGPCDRSTYEWVRRDAQPGVNGGMGLETTIQRARVFVEGDVHYVRRTSAAGTPTNDYFLLPIALGVRF
jgi:hypothetical protein